MHPPLEGVTVPGYTQRIPKVACISPAVNAKHAVG